MALLTAPFSLSNLSLPHQKASFFWRYKWRIQRYTVAVNSSFYRHVTLVLTVFFKMRYRQCLLIPSSRIWNQKRNCTIFRTVMDCTLPSALRARLLSVMTTASTGVELPAHHQHSQSYHINCMWLDTVTTNHDCGAFAGHSHWQIRMIHSQEIVDNFSGSREPTP